MEFRELKSVDFKNKYIVQNVVETQPFYPISKNESFRKTFVLNHPLGYNYNPITYCHVAPMNFLPSNINQLFENQEELETADNAVLYTITTPNKYFANFGLGSQLINKTLSHLTNNYSNIQNITTMSPIPGFKKWLNETNEMNLDKNLNLDNMEIVNMEIADNIMTNCQVYLDLNIDPVQRFHTNNGAKTGEILWMADKKNNWNNNYCLMVRYIYK